MKRINRIAELILEASFLKRIPRSGYQYLGAGRETVAEHVYSTTFIAFTLAQLEPAADAHRLLCMCLVHDLAEARLGDLNYVQKHYVRADETAALRDTLQGLPFDSEITALIDEFNAAQTLEACLARDADQLSLLVDLKGLQDTGFQTPQTWLPHVRARLKTEVGRQLAAALMENEGDAWWRKIFY